jgi:peptidoglycan hydrolase-like protein with peptidoglycan-binding domain
MAMANRLLNPVAPDPLPVVNGRRVLWNKSPEDLFEGRDVLSIQQWANPRFSYAKLDEDGLFGNDCERFAKEFQARVKLASDGVIGAQTYAQMEKLGFR